MENTFLPIHGKSCRHFGAASDIRFAIYGSLAAMLVVSFRSLAIF
jgi:hypothetical protein